MTSAYRAALLASRLRMGALERATGRDILAALREWSLALEHWLATRPADPRRTSLAETRAVVDRLSIELAGKLRRAALTGRDLSFDETLALWRKASVLVAERRGVPNALLGAVRAPPLPILALHANRPGARTWQTTLDRYAGDASREVDAVVRTALLDGVSPVELASRLRKYVVGSEPLQSAFKRVQTTSGETWKINLRDVPKDLRGSAQQMRQNAERIAFTEMHASRFEAEHQAMMRDPLIEAVKWDLSNDRGTQEPPAPPCACDLLATNDFYGLGAGVYPLDAVPALPHPWCRCALTPIERPVDQAGQPKPQGLTRRPGLAIPRSEGLSDLTKARLRSTVIDALDVVGETAGAVLRGAEAAGRRLAGMVTR